MIEILKKQIGFINLTTKTVEIKTYGELYNYFGGVGLGIKLYQMFQQQDPLIIAIGPLNGFFPFASKATFILKDETIEDIYLGGSLSTSLKFTGLDALVIYGKAKENTIIDVYNKKITFHSSDSDINSLGLPGRKSVITWLNNTLLHNGYFHTQEGLLERAFAIRNTSGLVVTGTDTYSPQNFEKYTDIYNKILEKQKLLTVLPGNNPSCSHCPMGCGKSKTGEIGGNILSHSLCACAYADLIFSDIGIVFACLNALGHKYKHEDIENLPRLVENTLYEIRHS